MPFFSVDTLFDTITDGLSDLGQPPFLGYGMPCILAVLTYNGGLATAAVNTTVPGSVPLYRPMTSLCCIGY